MPHSVESSGPTPQRDIKSTIQNNAHSVMDQIREWMPSSLAQFVLRKKFGVFSFADRSNIRIPDTSETPLVYAFDKIDDALLSHVGGKAANLIHLRKAGLPVPAGYCIPTDVHEYYLEMVKFLTV